MMQALSLHISGLPRQRLLPGKARNSRGQQGKCRIYIYIYIYIYNIRHFISRDCSDPAATRTTCPCHPRTKLGSRELSGAQPAMGSGCMCMSMYVCTYIYIYIYICTHIERETYIERERYTHTHTHTHTHMYIYIIIMKLKMVIDMLGSLDTVHTKCPLCFVKAPSQWNSFV